ncbi:MAG: ATP-binding protein [Candidatus Aureabacteria bacterium]|nr:ATP-binding protein [Candidatus Auribacterota bacterium]
MKLLRERHQSLKWLMVGRLVLITALLGVSPYALGLKSTPFFYVIGFFYAVTVVYSLLLKTGVPLRIQAYAQFFLDSAVITLLLSFTGGIDSNFVILYVLTIVFASIIIGGQSGIVIAVSCGAMYAGLGALQCYGAIPLELGNFYLLSGDPLYVSYMVLVRTTIFCILGYLGDYLVNSLNRNRFELNELKKLNERILSQIKSGLITTDAAGKIIFVNSAAEEILGHPRNDMMGKGWQLFLGRQVDDFDDRWFDDEARSFSRCEITVRRRDGREIPIGFTVSSLVDTDGAAMGLLILFRDLTQIRRMEERMRREMKRSATGAVLASVAHEVRTPLAAIRGAVEVLREGGSAPDSAHRLMGVILKEADRLNRIVSDFIEYSDVRSDARMRRDIAGLLGEVLDLVRQGREIPPAVRLVREGADGPVWASVDENRITQVFVNLVTNALDAVGRGGTVSVAVERVRQAGNGRDIVRVRVADTGPGMSAEKMAHLFEPFYSTKESGSGLGLFIAERIVSSHGGQIEVESREGGGAVFTVTLPSGADTTEAR